MTSLNEVVERIFRQNEKIMFATGIDERGKIVAGKARKDVQPLNSEDIYKVIIPIVVGVGGKVGSQAGRIKKIFVECENFGWLVVPFKEEMVVVSFEPGTPMKVIEDVAANVS